MTVHEYVNEPARRSQVAGQWDVVVAGGGIAGVAAAVAAARNGARTCLVERYAALGGLATLGVVVTYLPLCDGCGRQVIAGLGEELLKLSIRDGSAEIPAAWARPAGPAERAGQRYRLNFNPTAFLLELEGLVTDCGVDLFYDTRFCDVAREQGRIEAVLVENKSGRLALRCGCVVDATGDADVCARAGEPTASLNTNVRCGWFYRRDASGVRLDPLSEPYHPEGEAQPDVQRSYAGDDGRDVSEQIVDSRRMLRRRMQDHRQADPSARALLVPTTATHRMTRRLVGAVELTGEHVHQGFDDAVGLTGDWRRPGPVYAIPLGALAGTANRNLLAAGRCISSRGTAWDVTRAIPTCAVTGEAAGTAAAMAARSTEGRIDALDTGELQGRLRRQGVLLDEDLLRPAR